MRAWWAKKTSFEVTSCVCCILVCRFKTWAVE